MRVLTKVLSGALVLAAAVAVQFGVGATDASAATIAVKNVTIDYEKQQLKIASTTDLEVYYGVATVKNVKKKVDGVAVTKQVMSVATWDSYDYKANMLIDLSKLNRAKDNYIQLKGDKNTDPLIIKIPAVLSKVSAKFDPVSAKVTFNNITDKKNPVAVTDTLEYRTAYSGWNTYAATTDLSIYQPSGATLYFRIAAKAAQALNVAGTAATGDIEDADGNKLSIYTVGSFPGVEAKVAIGKLANAPKVTANYLKQQFTLPKGTEYRVATSAKLNAWTTASATAATQLDISTISSLVGNLTSATLEVRTAATETKPASKVNHFAFNMPGTISGKSTNATANKTDAARLAYDISANYVGASATAKDITVEYVYNAKSKKYTGLKFTNLTGDTYQIAFRNTGEDAPAASFAAGLKTIAPGKVVELDGVVAKETTISTSDGAQVYIHKVGNAKQQIWSTAFVGLGTVKFPENPPTN